MKKTLLFCLMTLGAATAAPVKPADIVNPSQAALQAACDGGYSEGETGQEGAFETYIYGVGGGTGVTLQSKQGAVYSSCRSRAQALKAKPAIDTIKDLLVVLVYGKTTGKPGDTERWATALVVNDAQGNELGRLSPDFEDEGSTRNWDVSCVSSVCTWSGNNNYVFNYEKPIPDSFLKIIADPNAASLVVLVSRGQGIERYTVDTDQAGKLDFGR